MKKRKTLKKKDKLEKKTQERSPLMMHQNSKFLIPNIQFWSIAATT